MRSASVMISSGFTHHFQPHQRPVISSSAFDPLRSFVCLIGEGQLQLFLGARRRSDDDEFAEAEGKDLLIPRAALAQLGQHARRVAVRTGTCGQPSEFIVRDRAKLGEHDGTRRRRGEIVYNRTGPYINAMCGASPRKSNPHQLGSGSST